MSTSPRPIIATAAATVLCLSACAGVDEIVPTHESKFDQSADVDGAYFQLERDFLQSGQKITLDISDLAQEWRYGGNEFQPFRSDHTVLDCFFDGSLEWVGTPLSATSDAGATREFVDWSSLLEFTSREFSVSLMSSSGETVEFLAHQLRYSPEQSGYSAVRVFPPDRLVTVFVLCDNVADSQIEALWSSVLSQVRVSVE